MKASRLLRTITEGLYDIKKALLPDKVTSPFSGKRFRPNNIFVKWIKRVLRYQYLNPYNVVKIRSLNRSYHDPSEVLLHAMFAVLVDYVEVELAWLSVIMIKNSELRKKGFSWWDIFKFRVCDILRSEKLGKEHLRWEKSLKEGNQAAIAKEVELLYNWWKKRPQRKDPMDLSGLSKFYDKYRDKIMKFRPCNDGSGCSESYNELTKKQEKEYDRLLKLCWKLEEEQRQEDINMMIRLAKIRDGLWT